MEKNQVTSAGSDTQKITQNNNEVRIVMVGKTGIGKSASGNTILGRESFQSKCSSKSLTQECSKDSAEIDGQKVSVIDTPGLFDTSCDLQKTAKDLCQCICFAAPGPHIFLVVISVGRFTQEEKETVKMIKEIFGEAADKYSMVLFTRGDDLGKTTIEEFVEENQDLKELVGRCNGQYHVFNNNLEDKKQVTELLKKIRHVVQKNGGSHYTNEMFQKAERKIREKQERILKEQEEKIRKAKEKIEKNVMEKYEEKIEKTNKQVQAEREKWKEMEEKRTRESKEREKRLRDEMEQRTREREAEIKHQKEAIDKLNEEVTRKRAERELNWFEEFFYALLILLRQLFSK